ncbi:hypothetical protein NDU88_009048, partial [Pleurodeles waltl]
PLPNVTRQEVPDMSTSPAEEAHSDDSSSVQLDLDDQPSPSRTSGQSVPLTQSQATTEPPPLETPAQHPPSGPISLSPGHIKQQCVHHYREPRLTHHPKKIRDLGAVVVGTRSRGRRHRNPGELGGMLCDRGQTGQGNPLSTRPYPPSWEHTTTPRRRWRRSWPSFRIPSGPGGSGHTVQGTEAQEHRGTGRAAVRQGEDRPREPTLHEALSNIMGAYHHSQETMAKVLAKFKDTQRLQEEQYLGFREELKAINSTLGSIVGVLKELVNTRRDTVAHEGALDTSLDDELPTTSAGTSG